jgi:hypothetical protein
MKGVNLGFASVFFEILAQGPSIYRGFGSMISCACRTPSPCFPIQWGFGFDRSRLRLQFVMTTRVGSAGPAGKVSAHGHIPGLKPFLFSILFSNLKITSNSTQI